LNKPLVSICIPTFNREQYLAQTIESALNQDYENLEVIVADNCSSDGTQNLVNRFIVDSRFSYYRNETNIGMVNNWKGLLDCKVRGEWFLLLSDDDYLINPSYISEAIAIANEHADINVVYADGYLEYVKMNKRLELNLPYQRVEDGKNIFMTMHAIKPQAFTLCNILFKTELSKQLNAFSNPSNLCCDSELFLKMCLTGKVGVVKKYVSVYRFHDSNLITQKRTVDELVSMAIDVFVEPQVMASKMNNFSASDLKLREKIAVIPYLKNIVMHVYALDARLGRNLMMKIKEKGIDSFGFNRDPVFLLKITLARNLVIYRLAIRLKNFIRKIL
jgi:glycosyltransferase involved in cell wall biosynthesis